MFDLFAASAHKTQFNLYFAFKVWAKGPIVCWFGKNGWNARYFWVCGHCERGQHRLFWTRRALKGYFVSRLSTFCFNTILSCSGAFFDDRLGCSDFPAKTVDTLTTGCYKMTDLLLVHKIKLNQYVYSHKYFFVITIERIKKCAYFCFSPYSKSSQYVSQAGAL